MAPVLLVYPSLLRESNLWRCCLGSLCDSTQLSTKLFPQTMPCGCFVGYYLRLGCFNGALSDVMASDIHRGYEGHDAFGQHQPHAILSPCELRSPLPVYATRPAGVASWHRSLHQRLIATRLSTGSRLHLEPANVNRDFVPVSGLGC